MDRYDKFLIVIVLVGVFAFISGYTLCSSIKAIPPVPKELPLDTRYAQRAELYMVNDGAYASSSNLNMRVNNIEDYLRKLSNSLPQMYQMLLVHQAQISSLTTPRRK